MRCVFQASPLLAVQIFLDRSFACGLINFGFRSPKNLPEKDLDRERRARLERFASRLKTPRRRWEATPQNASKTPQNASNTPPRGGAGEAFSRRWEALGGERLPK